MQNPVERVKFISLTINEKTFDSILKQKVPNILVENTPEWIDKLQQPNEFIRFKQDDFYMDLRIIKILYKTPISIFIGEILDCNKIKHREPKKLRNK